MGPGTGAGGHRRGTLAGVSDAATGTSDRPVNGAPPDRPAAALPPVVAAEEVARWLAGGRDDVVVADVRWYLDGRSGRDAYRAGHVPGAVWVDVDAVLAAPPSAPAGRHPLPSPDAFASALGALGIGDDDLVVAYDDQGGGMAARLVWMLRRTGQGAALLDGGLGAWPGPLATGDEVRPPVRRRVRPWPAALVRDADQVAAAAAPGAVVLDARVPGRYAGTEGLPSERRWGHVPGARSAPWPANLGDDGRFRSPDELRAHYAALGADGTADVVVYCGSGVTACHDLLALERAGLPPASLYPGSWSAWSEDDARPVATGPEPGGDPSP